LNPRTPTGQAPEACAFGHARRPPPRLFMFAKRFKSCCKLLRRKGELDCLLTVRFRKLERSGPRPPKYKLPLERVQVPGLETNATTRNE
jgi:hypothetical protein